MRQHISNVSVKYAEYVVLVTRDEKADHRPRQLSHQSHNRHRRMTGMPLSQHSLVARQTCSTQPLHVGCMMMMTMMMNDGYIGVASGSACAPPRAEKNFFLGQIYRGKL